MGHKPSVLPIFTGPISRVERTNLAFLSLPTPKALTRRFCVGVVPLSQYSGYKYLLAWVFCSEQLTKSFMMLIIRLEKKKGNRLFVPLAVLIAVIFYYMSIFKDFFFLKK